MATYLEELAQTTGLDAESLAALQKVLGNTKFAEEVEKGVARQSDYSRNMDTLTKARTEFEANQKSWKDWYDEAVVRDAEREAEFKRVREAGGAGGGAGGAGGGGTGGNGGGSGGGAGAPGGLTLKEIQEREGRMISIVKQGMRLASRHAAKFGEELDTDALEKIAVEKGLTLDRAYDEYVRPRVEAAQKAEHDAAIKKAHDDGVTEGLSKRDVPGEGERAFHPMFRQKPADGAADPSKLSDRQRADNFASAWATEAAKK